MKKKIILLLTISMIFLGGLSNESNAQNSGIKAAWITTVHNTDWPSKSSKGNQQLQKNEMIQLLDELKRVGINTVMLQVRPKGDALYKSNINPWSDVLTGTQGNSPGYDPLEFAIVEAHKRGIKVHAWLNPYRVTTKGTNINALNEMHPARKNPSWVITHNDALYYNPEKPEVKQHILDTINEIIINYNIDGIHLDDYFYPRDYPLPAGESKDGIVANARRNHINETVRRINEKINSVNSNIEFGISPAGIWKNKSSDKTGSDTRGHESYYSDYADARTWIQNNWIDYIVPQIYWEIGHSAADYSKLIPWWSNEVKGTNVNLYIGQGVYKDEVAIEIDKHLELNKSYDQIKGNVFFSTSDILNNRKGCKDKVTSFYNKTNKVYYLDINSFIGEETVKEALGRLKADTGWYANYKAMNKKEPIYSVKVGGFVGENSVKSATARIKDITGKNAIYRHDGHYSGGEKTPIYRIETGGFVGEEKVKKELEWLKSTTGWWATYEPNGTRPNEYKIVTGGFVGEERVKKELDWLKNTRDWWATYKFNGNYHEVKGNPIYYVYVNDIVGENSANNLLEKVKQSTGWYSVKSPTGNYIYHYQIITGGFNGLSNANSQAEFVKNKYGWYAQVREQ